jgi:hypothetical protein
VIARTALISGIAGRSTHPGEYKIRPYNPLQHILATQQMSAFEKH